MHLFIILLTLAAAELTPPAAWQNPSAWTGIREGSTPDQVRRLLGDPAATEETRTLEVWYYQDVPTDGSRPSAGRLVFRKSPEGTQLDAFTEPDWSRVPDWRQLNKTYREQLLAERQAARPQPPIAQPQPQPQPQPQKPVALRSRPAVTTAPAAPAETRQTPEDRRTQFTSRYFLTIGGAFIAMAAIFTLCHGSKFYR